MKRKNLEVLWKFPWSRAEVEAFFVWSTKNASTGTPFPGDSRNTSLDQGQGLIEYALILVLVFVVVLIVLLIMGPAVGNIFSNVIRNF